MLYLQEHLSCPNYEMAKKPVMEYKNLVKGESFQSYIDEHKILVIMKGLLYLTFGEYNQEIVGGRMIVIPGGCKCITEAREDVDLIICRLRNDLHLCEYYSLEKLFNQDREEPYTHLHLALHDSIYAFFTNLRFFVEDNIRCVYFYDLKLKELFFLLRNYYEKQNLQMFFSPLLSSDLTFSEFVLQNHHKVKNVKEFAELANYSVSGFEKRFKKVFKVPAYKWMKEQKAKNIHYEICHTHRAFKEIGWDFGFSSPAQFNDFCKSNFDATPGQLREASMNEQMNKQNRKLKEKMTELL